TMSTTLPSPRMEAPLIRSVATVWSSSALMTSSSSPSRLSTIIPSFRSPIEITSTKIFSDPPWAPRPGAGNFRDCVQGHGVQPLLYPEQQGLDDGQSERQLEAEGGALAHSGLNLNR